MNLKKPSLDIDLNLTVLAARLEQTEARLEQSEFRAERSENRGLLAERRLRLQGGLLLAGICLSVLLPVASPAIAQGYGVTLAQLLNRVIALETKTQFVSVSDGQMNITGTNLHILSGSGATNGNPDAPSNNKVISVNGLGNLIIGYNEADDDSGGEHGGSHNLVVGNFHDYTSFGGVVVGQANRILGQFATVTGGASNTASGDFDSVTGGSRNTANGGGASVTGGFGNTASGELGTVSGGNVNTASAAFSSVSGGDGNNANGVRSSISGGQNNTAGGFDSSVSGGQNNDAGASFSSVSGGFNRDIGSANTNNNNWKAGGLFQNL